MHSWCGEIQLSEKILENTKRVKKIESKPCHYLFDRLIVLQDGTVPSCCLDSHHAYNAIGNVKNAPPIEIFSNQKMKKIRELFKKYQKIVIIEDHIVTSELYNSLYQCLVKCNINK